MALLAAVGNDFDFAHHDIGAVWPGAVHARRERQLEFADAVGFEGELRAADAAGFDREGLFAASSWTSENQSSGCELAG